MDIIKKKGTIPTITAATIATIIASVGGLSVVTWNSKDVREVETKVDTVISRSIKNETNIVNIATSISDLKDSIDKLVDGQKEISNAIIRMEYPGIDAPALPAVD